MEATRTSPGLLKEGLLLPLDPLVQQSGVELGAYGPGLDALRYEGKLYEIPYLLNPNLVLYNPKLFAAAGVEVPKAGWTWEEFRETARRLTQPERIPSTWGFALKSPNSFLSIYMGARGADGTGGYVNEARMKEALSFIGSMVQDGSMPKVERGAASSPACGDGLFASGMAAMTIESVCAIGLGGYPEGVAALPMPVHRGERAPSCRARRAGRMASPGTRSHCSSTKPRRRDSKGRSA